MTVPKSASSGKKNSGSKLFNPPHKKYLGSKMKNEVLTDEISLLKPRFHVDDAIYIERLWDASENIHKILQEAESLEEARENLYAYLDKAERKIFDVDCKLHALEQAIVRDAIRVFRSIIGPINEKNVGFSALKKLWKLARKGNGKERSDITIGFLLEFIYLFKAVEGNTGIYGEEPAKTTDIPEYLKKRGKEAAKLRTRVLDDLGEKMLKYFKRYPSGLEEDMIKWREKNKARILEYYGASEEDWNDYRWHLRKVIRDDKTLLDLIDLPLEKAEAVKKAVKHKIPFGITPYYLSLMEKDSVLKYDRAVRAQVIPPSEYVDQMAEHKNDRSAFDFMGERDTSPIELVTRRYPMIAIVKPFNTCAQICVYCQRNWEIMGVQDPNALASRENVDKALAWLDRHKTIGDVLITGGDPIVMNDKQIERILAILDEKDWIYRIRFGTRTPVVLPQRWTDSLLAILEKYHKPPKREIAIVTHFEHSSEITPEAAEAVQKIRKLGVSVYNQEVYTIENSRRFESVKLRRDLKSIGVDPYYTFNMKGKEETRRMMVPIARLLQERKEEARLLPGLDRTDEPVFNVPRMGKNHLRAFQDHRLIMILPNGSRVYEFHPWEKNIEIAPPYNYADVPIYDYLEELAARGENLHEYRTIWYYY